MKTTKQNYTLTYKQFGEVQQATVEGTSLQDALTKLLEQCIKEDDTGVFFELEYADVDYFKTQDNFHIVKYDEVEYGILLDSYTVQ